MYSNIIKISIPLTAIVFLTNNVANFSHSINTFSAFVLICIFVYQFFPIKIKKELIENRNYFIAGISGIILSIFIAKFSFFEIYKLIALSIFIFSFDLILRSLGRIEKELSVIFLTASFYTFFFYLYKHFSIFWHLMSKWSLFFSHNIAAIIKQNLLLNITPTGTHITILFFFFILSAWLLCENRKIKILVYFTLILIFVNAVYILVHLPAVKVLEKIFNVRKIYLTSLNMPVLLILLNSYTIFLVYKYINFSSMKYDFQIQNKMILALSTIFLLIGLFLLEYRPKYDSNNKKIFLYDKGYMNWNIPEYGKYGRGSGGMFGILPGFLKDQGFEVKKDSIITYENLKKEDVLVIINLNKNLSKKEITDIWKFVEQGGSLLAMGDHTGLAGIREPLNELLAPTKIKLNFDSGHYIRDWLNSFEFFSHYTNYKVKNENDINISVGASLDIPLKAKPVITGKYGFSDLGNYNDMNNAFLGDRRYNKGEYLGDIVLTAGYSYGKGKILVFGDTSSFQNGSFFTGSKTVKNIFLWLSYPNDIIENYNNIIFIVLVIILIIVFSRIHILDKNLICMYLMIVLFLGISIKSTKDANVDFTNPALIDYSHFNNINLKFSDSFSVLGLRYNLIRNGYNPVLLKEFNKKNFNSSKIFISIAPEKDFSAGEIKILKSFMEKGGTSIISGGWNNIHGLRQLLNEFDLFIEDYPLGAIPPSENEDKGQFYNAWPILVKNQADLKVLVKGYKDYPVVIEKERGSGKLIFISDSGFFINRNFESVYTVQKNNISFFKELLTGEPLIEKTETDSIKTE